MISDFLDEGNGYLVVINYHQFISKLVCENFDGFGVSWGEVSYSILTNEEREEKYNFSEPYAYSFYDIFEAVGYQVLYHFTKIKCRLRKN